MTQRQICEKCFLSPAADEAPRREYCEKCLEEYLENYDPTPFESPSEESQYTLSDAYRAFAQKLK